MASEKYAADPNYNTKMTDEIANGPVKERGCTDIVCVPIFIAAQILFLIVSFMGTADGDINKLYMPRDFQGAYCDASTNWNNGPDTSGKPKLSYMMNVSATTDVIAKQLLCSSAVKDWLSSSSDFTSTQLATYNCACCHTPCASCEASLDNGGDITSAAGITSTIGGRMGELTDVANVGSLASPSGMNGDMFTNMWSEATKYFVSICVEDCTVDYTTLSTLTDLRSYTYEPDMDNLLKPAWDLLLSSGPTEIQTTIANSFTFEALPMSVCPYDASYCVPMPGVQFEEIVADSGYCYFTMAAEVTGAIGDSASAAFESLGGNALTNAATDGFGQWIGHVISTMDTVIIMAVLAFVIGLLFMVVLRFMVGICVWIAVLLTVLIFPLGGALCFVRSGQCQGDGIFETGLQVVTATTVTAVSSVGGSGADESMTGNGADYRGAQTTTRNGYTCTDWSTKTAEIPNYSTENADTWGLTANYCRNPYLEGDLNIASTIWCYTTDATVTWELCSPIGVIQPECTNGYAVNSETMRDVLKWCSYIIWALGVVWIIIIGCFMNRIRLAIKLNQVGAEFIGQTPLIVTVPIVQVVVGIIWIVLWSFFAAFLLSQVPDDYVPTGAYETYLEAYGIDGDGLFESGTAGACTGTWPTGGVWKDSACEVVDGVTKCWRCYPPRYVFDAGFAYSFFVFLWNNAFNIALGQVIIAGAVSAWFFAAEKGSDPVIMASVKIAFRYHLGSIAFGSFIIALIQFIRACMKYLEKQAQAQKNKVMVLVFKCVGCCIWCFEKCMQFLNKNAYIQIALLGTNFCTSAKKAFFLILRNAARFATVAVLGQGVQAIGVFCITAGTTILGYLIVRSMHDDIPPFMPCLCFLAIGYVVSQLFMSVFGMAVDTCLQCFIATEEMGGCSTVPETLQSMLPQVAEEARKTEGSSYQEEQ